MEILLTACLVFILINIGVTLFKKNAHNVDDLKNELYVMKNDVAKMEPSMRREFAISREEVQKHSKESREELSSSGVILRDGLVKTITDLSGVQKSQLETFSGFLQTMIKGNEEQFGKLISRNEETQKEFKSQLLNSFKEIKDELTHSLTRNEERTNELVKVTAEKAKVLNEILVNSGKENRFELATSLKAFENAFSTNVRDFNEIQRQKFGDLLVKQDQLKAETEIKLDKIRETVETKLRSMQEENGRKLEEMRMTVDEKLQTTLEKRFNDSFTVISERLELVHKGLGEMQSLAVSVGDIKKVMTNVKSRGVLGEYQLANILEDLLTNEQYERNVKTKIGSGAIVEFAIRLPNHNNLEKVLWLPVDSKFPKEDYEALVDAYDEGGDAAKLDALRKAFKLSIIKNAKDIKDKYIDPPNTTEYGIMFLPFESLYAEVLRTPGLFEQLQKEYKITITGPTTLSALLNSLQMGFRTLAIEKRSSEVWDILSGVKTEFVKFGTVLERTKKQLQAAANTIDEVGRRGRVLEKKLKNVQELSPVESQKTESEADTDAIEPIDAKLPIILSEE